MSLQTIINFFIKVILFIILLCSCPSFAQNLRSGIKERECGYSKQYNKPDAITFVFAGNPKYVNYYFRDLKEHIFKSFTQKGITVSFLNGTTDDSTFVLKIDDAKTIHENDGHDREMRYELVGILSTNDVAEPALSFKITVNTIHDINQQNKEVAKYLLRKVLADNWKI